MHFVVFLSKSILANSFGECILENMYVLPIEIHGAFRISTKGCIGPVPAFDTFRIDLPNGLGTYKVFSAHYDALSNGSTGWRFKDGSASTITTVTASSTTTNYIDINDNSLPATGFDYANESFIEHEFTNTYMEVERDTTLAAGGGVLTAVWLEYVPGPPPPAGGNTKNALLLGVG